MMESTVFKHFNYLHTIPEVGMQEFKTSAYLAAVLDRAGYQVQTHIGGATGVVGVLDSGVPGPVLGLRADMDALGTPEHAAHLCGHDSHMSMLLAAAEEIIDEGLVKKGKLKILFQPAEETSGGAISMIDGGAVDDVDYLIGMHIRPIQECRLGQAAPAMYYSSAGHVVIEVTGRQSHGARPYLGVSALDAGCLIVQAANALRFDSSIVHNLKATRFLCDAGVMNAVPGKATLVFDLRSQDNDLMDSMLAQLRRAAENAAATVGASIEWKINNITPASIISPEVTDIISDVIREEMGEEALVPPITTAGGEDFFWYPRKRPSIKTGFIGLGADAEPGLHAPDMHFNHDCLPNGVKLLKGAVRKILG